RPVYFDKVPAHKLSDGDCRLIDLDGNGIADLLCTGPDFYTLYYRTEDGWSERPQVLPRSQTPPVSFGDPHVHVADMNGDGLQDLVRVDGGGVTWWPYLGNGRWADPVEMRNPPQPPPRYDPRRLQLVDVDGDGCADFVYVGGDSVTVWLNQGGVRVGDPEVILFTPFAAPNQIRICDFNARGTTGVLWSSVNIAGRRGGYLFLDLTGGVKPYLLTSVDNGIGLVTRITWRSSTEFGVDASEAGTPWQTFHPFPVQCVAEVRALDQVTGQESVTRNVYGPARFDGDSRTFLGFGRVEVQSLGDASIPTLRTVNVYHLGLDPNDPTRRLSDDERLHLSALRRRLLRTEIYGDDGTPNA